MTDRPAPARRTALLGLLAELRGAGAAFHAAGDFLAAATSYLARPPRNRLGVAAPHGVGVVVDSQPERALPFARAAAAIGIPVTFLLRHDIGGSASKRRPQEQAIRRLVEYGHALALHVDAKQAADDPAAFADEIAATAKGFADAKAVLSALCARHADRDPLDPTTIAALLPDLVARTTRSVPDWVGCVGTTLGTTMQAQIGVIDDHRVLRTASLRPFYEIHASPPDVVDVVTVSCMIDTAARGVCWHELRLSSVSDS